MTTYAIIDAANLFHRARHVVRGDAYEKAGLALSIVFKSLRKMHRDMKADHMVFCLEGRSWRYDVFPEYKAKRRLEQMKAKATDAEEEEAFFSVLNDFNEYVSEKTRCTTLQSPGVEGDDFVARWIQLHPNDKHIILSGDSDFLQLIDTNVSIFNGVEDLLITIDGVFDGKGQPMEFFVNGKDGKLKVNGTIAEMKMKHEKAQKAKEKAHNAAEKARIAALELLDKKKPPEERTRHTAITYAWEPYSFEPEPEWWKKALFVKLIRGDSGDGVFSAFPGVRYLGSAKKVGISEAWEDRNTKGYNWNNFMLQKWSKLIGSDKDGNAITKEVRVLDEYKFNESLIDLTKQPDEVKNLMDTVIVQAVQKEPIGNVGIHFLRFCGTHDLVSLGKESSYHAEYLNKPYAK